VNFGGEEKTPPKLTTTRLPPCKQMAKDKMSNFPNFGFRSNRVASLDLLHKERLEQCAQLLLTLASEVMLGV
jgi:hypothetical protein